MKTALAIERGICVGRGQTLTTLAVELGMPQYNRGFKAKVVEKTIPPNAHLERLDGLLQRAVPRPAQTLPWRLS